MRLSSIKLSGFKSFADPTTLQLPGRLVGVVGPNGCGKSNIIDAVRWVLGESKASELRGESMQDVIFNGTTLRKGAGRASVELVFDNSSARAGGPWNQFAEIAVKRVLTRDGTSSYYLNSQPVRRRDVQDVFLGTGLGPRAYAIIGQGTISRIIESKPEELRLFLEEAAGVSKYKERRRETEHRLSDTRANLTRVEDIVRELGANLDKLEAQASVAAQYRALQRDGVLKQHQLWFLKHRDAAKEEARVARAAAEAGNALEARLAELRHVEAQLDAARQSHFVAGDELHASQGRLADAQLDVSRLEERIRYVVEGRQRLLQRLAELQGQQQHWRARRAQAGDELQRIAAQIAQADDNARTLGAQLQQHAAQLPGSEAALRAVQGRSDEQREVVARVQQQIQLLAAESRNTDEQSRQLESRRERLAAERQGLAAPNAERIAELARGNEHAAQAQHEADTRLTELTQAAPALDATRRAESAGAQHEAARLAEASARLDALRALQHRVQTEGKIKPWLARHGLDGLQGLWTRVRIAPGWETALESALRERINAFEVGRIETVCAFAADAPPARLAFYTAHGVTAVTPGRAPTADLAIVSMNRTLPRLSELLLLGDAGLQALLNDWLEGVYIAESLDAGLAARDELARGEVIMTREGHAVSQYAVAFYAPDSEQAGMLARAQEIENLERQARAQALLAEEAKSRSVRAEAAYSDAAQRLAAAQREAAAARQRAHELQVELMRLSQQAEAASTRTRQLDDELGEIDSQLGGLQQRRSEAESRFDEFDTKLGQTQERHAELGEAVIAAERQLVDEREALRTIERRAQEAQFESRTLNQRQAELQRSIETADEQLAANEQAGAQLAGELDALADTAALAGLQTALELRVERERALAAVRSRYDELGATCRRADEQRMEFERSLDPLREKITRLQLERQAAALGGAQYREQLEAANVDLEALGRSIDDGGVKLAGLQAEIERIEQEVEALGAVNLAALEELTTARERKTFLDAQSADLHEAIGTLEDAIRRIDLETRALLGSTFNEVNEHFGRMFPTLFGGGNARLQMTGDEILDAGVQVMAQPPGKKNSTIHLLSGGEKALTAIALVFAIFQLNPAPFCLLDEVDAPLDDANTDRYCKLVTEMASGTQFLFISHNKITMEMAEQLIGVTMQEQGVSRIVAVDMDEAVSLAEAAA